MTLTKAQFDTLVDIERAGEVGASYASYYRPLVKLLALGYVEKTGARFSTRYCITDAGRAALPHMGTEYKGRAITTTNVYPPIPVRDFDWCAYFEGEAEAGGYGYGKTEAEAVADFIENYADDHLERLS